MYPSRYVSMSTLHAVKNELNPKRSLFVGWPGLDYLSKEGELVGFVGCRYYTVEGRCTLREMSGIEFLFRTR